MKSFHKVFSILLCTVLLIAALLPFLWICVSSLKDTKEINTLPVKWLPSAPTFNAFKEVWLSKGFSNNWVQYLGNTIIVTVSVTVIVILVGTLMGYSLTRLRSKWVPRFISVFILIQLFNGPALILPIYAIVNGLGLYNTLLGYILVLVLFEIPFAILMSQNFIRTIPYDLDEAAKIDGCTPGQIFRKIIAPLAKPSMVTVGLMTFLMVWGEYPFATVLLESNENLTVSIALVHFMSTLSVFWNQMAAASIVVSVPVIIILLFAQKYLVQGLTNGAVK